jgi:hypothetical protein
MSTAQFKPLAGCTASPVGRHTHHLVILCLLAWLCLHGIAFTDFREFKLLLTSWSQLTLPPEKQYLYSSPWLAGLGRVVSPLLSPSLSYAALCATGLLLLVATLHKYLLSEHGANEAWVAWLLLMATPLPMVWLQWIGKSDTYLLSAWLLMRLVNRPAIHAALAMVMVLCHRELALLILMMDALLSRHIRLGTLLGALMGLGLMALYHHVVLEAAPMGRIAYATQDRWSIPLGNLSVWPAMLTCSMSWFWISVIAFCRPGWRDAIVLLACLAVAAMTLDFTRVFGLLSMPWILDLLQRGVPAAAQAAHTSRLWRVGIILMAIMPSAQLINFEVKGPRILDNITMMLGALHKTP